MLNYPQRDWLSPWRSLRPEEVKQLEAELRHEATPLHALYGKKTRAVARREDNDDVLYHISDDGRYAVAHLTWTGNNEENWPQVTFYDSLDEWIERVMEADHRESS